MTENNLPEQLTGDAERVSHVELARTLGISDRTVRTKRSQGLTDAEIAAEAEVLSPKHHPHRKKLAEMTMAAPSQSDDFLLQPAEPGKPLSAMAEASLRKEIAEASLRELRLAEEQGRLLDLDAASQEMSRLVRETRDSLTGMASRLAPRLAGISDERTIYMMMSEEIEAALTGCCKKLDELVAA